MSTVQHRMGLYDVAVVGAGVAGSTTALHLADAGLRVLLIDRARFPRAKVCGEGIFPAGVRELDRLGVLARLRSCSWELAALRLHLGRTRAEAPLSPAGARGLGVERAKLDSALLERATEAGVEVELGVTAQSLIEGIDRFDAIETTKGRIEARVLVAADGLNSTLRARAGLQPKAFGGRYGVNAHWRTQAPVGGQVDVHFQRGFEVYVTPVDGRLVNIALLLRKNGAFAAAGGLRAGYESLVSSTLDLRGFTLFDEPRAAAPFPAYGVRPWRRNLLCAGDAAGFFDGITGEGISLALRSSRHAATAVRSYLETGSPEPFKSYERKLMQLRAPSTFFGKLMLFLAGRPWLGVRVLSNLGRRPDVFSRLIAVSSGEMRFRDLRPADLLGLMLGV